MWRFTYATGIFLIFVCAACSRFTAESSHDPAASFQELKTYGWKPGPPPSIGDPRVNAALVNTAVRGAVDRDLTAKGFTQSSPDQADFLLAYDGGVDFKTSTVAITRSTDAGGGGWSQWQHLHSSDFEQGMIVLMVFDPQGKLMWRGVVTGVFDPTATPEQRKGRIADAIQQLLKPFPPQ